MNGVIRNRLLTPEDGGDDRSVRAQCQTPPHARMGTAIRDWEGDLEFLYYEYYVGKFGFAWPTNARDWVLRFNTEGADGLINRKAPGKPPLLNEAQRRELAAVIERGPIPTVDGVVRWRLIDLAQWVYQSYARTASKQALSRTVRAMGYRKLSARPRHHA